jgi:hypothetical protein
MFIILNIYVWFNPVEYKKTDFFDPCSKEMIAKYNIPEERTMEFHMDCAEVNSYRVNRLLNRKGLITEEEKKELIEKVNKYYEKN